MVDRLRHVEEHLIIDRQDLDAVNALHVGVDVLWGAELALSVGSVEFYPQLAVLAPASCSWAAGAMMPTSRSAAIATC